MNRIALLLTLCLVALSLTAPPAESRTARRAAAQQNPGDFWLHQDTFRRQAKMAFDGEMAREKSGDCVDAKTTYETNVCLDKAIDATTANYKAYTGALRSLLGLKPPGSEGVEEADGPTGKPLTSEELVKEFDEVEAAWETYRKAQCAAAYDEFRGGTIAPSMFGFCALRLMRGRMRDLDSIYYTRLHL
jgi:uncharacterized protein YecT (DUF1311 family)